MKNGNRFLAGAETQPHPLRWYQPTPNRLLVVLLAVEAMLLLSERCRWFAFNEKKGWTVLIAIATMVAAIVLMLLWHLSALLFHWRFQFSIRSLFVLTVAVAISLGWLAMEMKWARQQRETMEAIQKLGGKALFDYQCGEGNGGLLAGMPNPKPAESVWLQLLLGDDFFEYVTNVSLQGAR